ncbi:translocation/assembly module TamB domain-containing protein [Caenimonas sp. SL110]|uniref:translocation/assembly module TamB domain-containing protein n=1 Tax=Caenimonas sp. SL110 TaxID=1450524 RepID=UPI001EE72B7A|nr:translocation/assembly module TamB domain-containing protein [Caenimonas sp. SL110]
MRKALRIALMSLAGLFGLLVAASAFLWWWAGTPASLDWALERAARWQALQIEGASGSLRTGLKARRLRWEREGLVLEARAAELAWQPLSLMRGTLRLDYLRAGHLLIDDKRPPTPPIVPVSLALPLRVEIAQVLLGQLEFKSAANTIEVSHVTGTYSFDNVYHQVKLDRLRWQGGLYSGEGRVGAQGKLPVLALLQGRLDAAVPGGQAQLPLSFNARIEGPVADMRATAQLQTGSGASAATGAAASATARITPWGAQPLPEAHADFARLDLRLLWAQAPHTSLSGKLDVRPASAGTWAMEVEATNTLAGPWDKERAPVERIVASGEWRKGGQAVIRALEATVGGGEVRAKGAWAGADGWTVDGTLSSVDPAALHGALASLPVSGKATLTGEGKAIGFDVSLAADGASSTRSRARNGSAKVPEKGPDKDAVKSNEIAAAAAALELRSAAARGRWNSGALSLASLEVVTSDARLQASGDMVLESRSGSGRAELKVPGLVASVQGKLSAASGGGTISASAADLAQAARWLQRLPGAPAVLAQVAAGRAEARAEWQGGWRDPAVQAKVDIAQLDWRSAQTASSSTAPPATSPTTPPTGWTVRDTTATLNGRLADAALQVRGRAESGQRRISLELSGRGGKRGAPGAPGDWFAQVASLGVVGSDPAAGAGNWTLKTARPFDVRWSQGTLDASAGEALLGAPRSVGGVGSATITWDPVRYGRGELKTTGRIKGLPLAWIELVGGPQLQGTALAGDMVFDGSWDAALGATPRIRASLERASGDLTVLAETVDGAATRVKAGVREARLSVESQGEIVTAVLRWDSERGGTADARLQSRLSQGGAAGWSWPAEAPVSGTVRAQLPRIGVWSLLAPPGWRLRGSLGADLTVSGTRSAPQMAGTLAADDLALRSVVDGIELQGGRLRAHFEGTRLVVDEFRLRGPGDNGGTLVATGEGRWTSEGLQTQLTAEVTRLRASIRSDRQVTVSGKITASRDAKGTIVNGTLKVDQALIVLPDETAPRLGDDVVVRGAGGPILRAEARALQQPTGAKPPSQELTLDVNLELGDNLRVQGLGIDTRLRGQLKLTGRSVVQPRLTGVITTSGGEYQAYGQRLNIERGVIRFTGAADNPSLDILAIRPNLVQRVGVLISGSALSPFVRLYAEPDLPEAEKLSWLVTGRAAPSSGAETALVQQAAIALLANRAGGKKGLAASLGLDEVSFRRDAAGAPAIALGRRFGTNFYAAYERSISGALGTLFIFYDITRRITVRAEAGERTAVDLILTFSFD